MEKRATSKDVARLAGVSQATVSYVLNNKPGQSITRETRERVLKAARLLDYMPVQAARALRSSRTNCIAVSVNKNLMLPRYGQVLEGARGILEAEGYRLILCTDALSPGGYPDYLSCCLLHRADGILYIGADGKEPLPSALEYILAHQVPFAAYDACRANPKLSSVNLDYFSSARDSTARFLSLGGKRLAYLRPDLDTEQETAREAGVRAAVSACPGAALQVFSDFSPADARLDGPFSPSLLMELDRSARAFFSSVIARSGGDARFICSWGAWAQPLSSLLPEGRRPPSVLALAQVGSFLYGSMDPQILCCRLPNYTAGERCARLLLRQLENPAAVEKQTLLPAVYVDGAPPVC